MWIRTLAAESALFSLLAMFSGSQLSFDDTPVRLGNKIRRLFSDRPLTGPRCYAAIDLFSALAFLEAGPADTAMVFPLRRTAVHRCTRRMLVPDAAIVAMFGWVHVCEYIGAGVNVGAGHSA